MDQGSLALDHCEVKPPQRLPAKIADHELRLHDHQNFTSPVPNLQNCPAARQHPKPDPNHLGDTEPIPQVSCSQRRNQPDLRVARAKAGCIGFDPPKHVVGVP